MKRRISSQWVIHKVMLQKRYQDDHTSKSHLISSYPLKIKRVIEPLKSTLPVLNRLYGYHSNLAVSDHSFSDMMC